MKKFLLALMTLVVVGAATEVKAQCSGATVTFTNVLYVETATHYVYSFNWTYVQGNASIQVRVRCGGTFTYNNARCIPRVKDSTAGAHFFKDSIAKADIPVCNAPALKEIVLGVWTNPDCGGTYCPSEASTIILPVEFKSFNATRNRSTVALKWETSTEVNNAGFMVERNVGGTWQDIAYVPSQAVDGFSNSLLTYTFSDQNTVKGITQYRIRQIDLDGKFSLSFVRAVRGEGGLGNTVVFPNPSSSGNVSIVFEDANVKRDVSIFDMTGKVIKQWRNVTNNNLQVEGLPSGMFSVRILAVETGEQVVEKIVVNKR